MIYDQNKKIDMIKSQIRLFESSLGDISSFEFINSATILVRSINIVIKDILENNADIDYLSLSILARDLGLYDEFEESIINSIKEDAEDGFVNPDDYSDIIQNIPVNDLREYFSRKINDEINRVNGN